MCANYSTDDKKNPMNNKKSKEYFFVNLGRINKIQELKQQKKTSKKKPKKK